MSIGGIIGKNLNIDLTNRTTEMEYPSEWLYKNMLGGYGIGAYIVYQRQKAFADALGPENILGFATGPLTGTQAITGNRFTVFGKSPKTLTWGDANSGGSFGPGLKFAGYDGIYIRGAADGPVYLLIEDGECRILDAAVLWGLDTTETEERLLERHGKKAHVVCIGPAGERMSLLSCIMNDFGRAAGRSGLGAVMGSKRLKAVVAVGAGSVTPADQQKVRELRKKYSDAFPDNPFYDLYHTYGTAGITAGACKSGDTPIKNWGGVPADFPHPERISDDNVQKYVHKRGGCWGCPIACGGRVTINDGKYAGESHKPEYETLGAFGTLCLNDSVESIIKANDICNRAGMDTISVGATVAFAIECYQNGLINESDTGGLKLGWGDDEAVVRLTELITEDKDIGRLFSNGIKAAAEKLGPQRCAEWAMHVSGEELPMHDPRLNPGLATSYQVDATPGRHTQWGSWFHEAGFTPPLLNRYYSFVPDKYSSGGKGETARFLSCYGHVVNAAGMCMFGAVSTPAEALPGFLGAVMGIPFTMEDIIEIGQRIATMRMAFTIREGMSPGSFPLPGRMLGKPPLTSGPLEGVKLSSEQQTRDYLEAMGWDPGTARPLPETVRQLGLDRVINLPV